jgi:hypothetical protein
VATAVGVGAAIVGSAAVGAGATGFGGGLLVGRGINATGVPAKIVDFLVDGGAGKFNPGASPPGPHVNGDAGVPPAGTTTSSTTAGAPATTDDDDDDRPDGGVAPAAGTDTRVAPDGASGSGRGAAATVVVSRDEQTSTPEPTERGNAVTGSGADPTTDGRTDPTDARRTKRRTKGRTLAERRAARAQVGGRP